MKLKDMVEGKYYKFAKDHKNDPDNIFQYVYIKTENGKMFSRCPIDDQWYPYRIYYASHVWSWELIEIPESEVFLEML